MERISVSIYGGTVAHSAIVHPISECEMCDTCLRDPKIREMLENERRIIHQHWLRTK